MTDKQPMLLRGRPQTAKPRPTRSDCERIAQRVATARDMRLEDLIYGSKGYHRAARAETWARIIAEVGCSAEGLASAWGVSKKHVLESVADYRQEKAA